MFTLPIWPPTHELVLTQAAEYAQGVPGSAAGEALSELLDVSGALLGVGVADLLLEADADF